MASKRHRSEERSCQSPPDESCNAHHPKRRNISVPVNNPRNSKFLDKYGEFLCDRTVTFQGTKQFRNIISIELAEKSPYFATLLRYSDIRQPISVPAFLAEPFNRILEFIRAGAVELNETNVIETLLAADFMLLKELRSQCVQQLQRLLMQNIEFACEVWINVGQFLIANVDEIAFDVLAENFESFCTTNAYLGLPFDKVRELLNHDWLNVIDEKVVLQAGLEWLKANPEFKEKSDHILSTCRLGIMPQNEVHSMAHYDMYFYGSKFHHLLQYWPLSLKNLCMDLNLEKVFTPRASHQAIFVFGGWGEGTGPKAAVQVYDEKMNIWRLWSGTEAGHVAAATGEGSSNSSSVNPISAIPTRVYAGCVAVGDKVFLIGGYDGSHALKTSLCFDFSFPERGWQETSCMYERRYYVSVAFLDGFIYAVGGHNGEARGRLGSAERYSVEDNTWRMIAHMNHVRSDAGAAAVSGRVYVCGGFEGRRYHNSVECYNPQVNEWTLVQVMNFPRGGVAVIEHQGAIYAVGGNNGTNRLKTLERYDVALNTWTVCGEMTHRKSNLALSIMGQQLYIIGGWSDEPSSGIMDSVERYNLITGECTSVQQLCFPASATCACTVRGRKKVHMHLTQVPPVQPESNNSPVPSLVFTGNGSSAEPSDHGEGGAVVHLHISQLQEEQQQQEQLVASISNEVEQVEEDISLLSSMDVTSMLMRLMSEEEDNLQNDMDMDLEHDL